MCAEWHRSAENHYAFMSARTPRLRLKRFYLSQVFGVLHLCEENTGRSVAAKALRGHAEASSFSRTYLQVEPIDV